MLFDMLQQPHSMAIIMFELAIEKELGDDRFEDF